MSRVVREFECYSDLPPARYDVQFYHAQEKRWGYVGSHNHLHKAFQAAWEYANRWYETTRVVDTWEEDE